MHSVGPDLLFNSHDAELLSARKFPIDFVTDPFGAGASFVLEL